MPRAVLILPLMIGACTTPSVPTPSLAPRAAEAIDPRVPIPDAPVIGEVDPALRARLAQLLDEVRAGNQEFAAAADQADRHVAAAGSPGTETWIAAQQALSAMVAAKGRTARALSDIDAIAAERVMTSGGISPANHAAIDTAAREASAIDQRQSALIEALQARLGG